ncbi:alpha/beta hydrolase [Actinomyces sp. MRS3W]|uniref:alpha/beta hydrolase n=1 Tax=Actinomyces sp. MRS3W TaxID=2800796 RepID=UPI0028FD9DD1|nr:alpha/beta hydrolase [Actinomyces sp. MRS3W]MDU0347546.1 alpha/beta hydrolase [Actinomyces sp. MRS3W]
MEESAADAPSAQAAAAERHAPVDAWGPDVLGPGFRARTLPLLPDVEDDGAVATLIHHVPAEDPAALPGTPTSVRFTFLYLHGWNDYFFQTELAREISRIGGAFYALDLRRYGRSLREGQMLGWITSLTDYDEEIGLALAAIRAVEGWETPAVLCGHSTGGLIASLWADRHPGAISALVLNSAWLEIQGSEPVRLVGEPVVRTLARSDPRRAIPIPTYPPEAMYHITDGWDPERDGELPDPAWAEDPYVTGWRVNPRWRIRPSAPIRPGWLLAILAGQARVAAGLDVRCPVLSMGSARSHLSVAWTSDSRSTDTVVDADATARRAIGLGKLVTVARFDGAVHDLVLSAPPVREQVYSTLRRWLGAYALR